MKKVALIVGTMMGMAIIMIAFVIGTSRKQNKTLHSEEDKEYSQPNEQDARFCVAVTSKTIDNILPKEYP